MFSPVLSSIISRADNATSAELLEGESQYGYVPTRYVCIIFVVLFALSTFLHTGQAIFYRLIWPYPTFVLAGCLEVAGWSGRLWSSYDDTDDSPYMLQIVTTIIGPTPFLAGNFLLFGLIVGVLGQMYSRLTPRQYSILFVSCDIVSLVVQGAGGGIASAADTLDDANMGGNIMLGGIVFQLVIMTAFLAFAAEFFYRFFRNAPLPGRTDTNGSESTFTGNLNVLDKNMRIMIGALFLNTAFLYIRGIYRTIELAGGWNGAIIETEIWFNIFDGAMVLLAFYAMNIVHPGMFLAGEKSTKNKTEMTSV